VEERTAERAAVAPAPAAPAGEAWAALIQRLVRGLERGSRPWPAARRKQSLERALAANRRDAARLHERLNGLLGAWETDAAAEAANDVESPGDPGSGHVVPLDATAGALGAASQRSPEPAGESRNLTPPATPTATPTAEVPGDAAGLADAFAALAGRLAAEGAVPGVVERAAALCEGARRLLGQREHLVTEVLRLCAELAEGWVEGAEDEHWAAGPGRALRARLAAGLDAPAARATRALLHDARQRERALRSERRAAEAQLREAFAVLLAEVGGLARHTGRFEGGVARHARTIERATTLAELRETVQALLAESREVHAVVAGARERLHAEQGRVEALQARVRELEAGLRRLADEVSVDALTQVANRRGLATAFAEEVAKLERATATTAATATAAGGAAPPALSVGVIDIDDFKKLNDTLGHAAGDEALKALAATVQERLRPGDRLARWGGEEFVVLLPSTAPGEAQQVLTRLQRSLTAALFLHHGRDVFVTFSAGVTRWRTGEALEAALARADEALYEAKRSGKNRTCVG
jgi:diguanylate cyclase